MMRRGPARSLAPQAGTSLPSTMRRRRSIRSLSERSWVATTMLVPSSRFRDRMRSNTASAVCRSRFPVGSSASTHCGSRHERAGDGGALAFPPGELGRLVRCARSQADPFQHGMRLPPRRPDAEPADQQGHRDVLQRGELREEMVELVDEAEHLVANAPALAFSDGRERPAGDDDFPTVRRVESSETVKERALARSRGADQRNRLACLHHQLSVLQHVHVQRPLAERAIQPSGDEHRLTHDGAPPRAERGTRAMRGTASRARKARRRRRRPRPRCPIASRRAPS